MEEQAGGFLFEQAGAEGSAQGVEGRGWGRVSLLFLLSAARPSAYAHAYAALSSLFLEIGERRAQEGG